MTPRRLWVLLRALPYEAATWAAYRAAAEKTEKPTPDRIRDRAEHYRQQAAKQREGA